MVQLWYIILEQQLGITVMRMRLYIYIAINLRRSCFQMCFFNFEKKSPFLSSCARDLGTDLQMFSFFFSSSRRQPQPEVHFQNFFSHKEVKLAILGHFMLLTGLFKKKRYKTLKMFNKDRSIVIQMFKIVVNAIRGRYNAHLDLVKVKM